MPKDFVRYRDINEAARIPLLLINKVGCRERHAASVTRKNPSLYGIALDRPGQFRKHRNIDRDCSLAPSERNNSALNVLHANPLSAKQPSGWLGFSAKSAPAFAPISNIRSIWNSPERHCRSVLFRNRKFDTIKLQASGVHIGKCLSRADRKSVIQPILEHGQLVARVCDERHDD